MHELNAISNGKKYSWLQKTPNIFCKYCIDIMKNIHIYLVLYFILDSFVREAANLNWDIFMRVREYR